MINSQSKTIEHMSSKALYRRNNILRTNDNRTLNDMIKRNGLKMFKETFF